MSPSEGKRHDIEWANAKKRQIDAFFFVFKSDSIDDEEEEDKDVEKEAKEEERRRRIKRRKKRTSKKKKGDLRLSGPPSAQGARGGARTHERRIPAYIRAESLATVPPTPPLLQIACLEQTLRLVRSVHCLGEQDYCQHLSSSSSSSSNSSSSSSSSSINSSVPSRQACNERVELT
ncbi:hypothetical protein PoB_005433100 [Plakobranchus ocellatus]|uniref:Uncharacterized protein n=1 Tax=Plakobranchus ocellatus TaxID=259542 RepID=A0AAV4C927_9GAST|nr:hypothetical protein PoB_005433100 [Plakobranchus ocellatus]